MAKEIRLCWFCKWFYWSNAEPDYSDVTPGSDFSIACMKSHWDFDSYKTTADEFRKYLHTAEKCKDFVLLESIKSVHFTETPKLHRAGAKE